MTADWLSDLRAVMAEATAGPWAANPYSGMRGHLEGAAWVSYPDGEISDRIWREADARAIVALRNAWPAIEAALAQADADRALIHQQAAELRSERLRRELAEHNSHEAMARLEDAHRAHCEKLTNEREADRAELGRLRRVAACAARVHEQSSPADKCLWSWKDLATALAALAEESR